jgi:hypothetical protein
MKNEIEIWKDIPGYEGVYQVSSFGRVKSLSRYIKTRGLQLLPERILKLCKNKYGYLKCVLQLNRKKKYIQVHQIVAMAFLGHVPCGFERVINHKNFIRDDNRLENLEVVTSRENTNLKHLPSSSEYTGVSWSNAHKKWISTIVFNKKIFFLGHFDSEIEASEYYENALKAIKNGTKIIKKPFITSSKFVGVHWSKYHKKWVSRIKIKGKAKHLGYFKDEKEASECYVNFKKSIQK